jgi:hypothetical protein
VTAVQAIAIHRSLTAEGADGILNKAYSFLVIFRFLFAVDWRCQSKLKSTGEKMIKTLVFAGLLATVPMTTANASFLVDTGEPTSQVLSGPIIQNIMINGANQRNYIAVRFSLPTSNITSIEGYLFKRPNVTQNNSTFHIALYDVTVDTGFTLDGGKVPGTELYSSQAQFGSQSGWYGVNNLNWYVPAGEYFASFEVRDGDTYNGAVSNRAPTRLPLAALGNFGPTRWFPALQGTNNTLGIAFRLAGDVVPEPASWAMLIVGFGLTGAAMRRGRQAQAC